MASPFSGSLRPALEEGEEGGGESADFAFTVGSERINSTSETVFAEVNPEGFTTEYHLNYDVAESAYCNDESSVAAHTTSPGSLPSSDDSFQPLEITLSSLEPDAGYCAEVVAEHEGLQSSPTGKVFFSTSSPPSSLNAFIENASPTSLESASVIGEVDPGGEAASYSFKYDLAGSAYCNGESATAAHQTTPQSLGFADETNHEVQTTLTGLLPHHEYCVSIFVTTTESSFESDKEIFSTSGHFAPFPVVTMEETQAITEHSAEIFAFVEQERTEEPVSYVVDYDLVGSAFCKGESATPAHSTGSRELVEEFGSYDDQVVSETISALSAGTEYCAVVVATNSFGSSEETTPVVFKTENAPAPTAPVVTASTATATGETTATVEADVNPKGQATTYLVNYDLSSSEYCKGETPTPAHHTTSQSLGYEDEINHKITVSLSGLSIDTEYCAVVVATNGTGPGEGSKQSFTTDNVPPPPHPAVTASEATATGTSTATVEAEIDPEGQPTTYLVNYDITSSAYCKGETSTPAHHTTSQSLGHEDESNHKVTVTLSGLSPDTEYCAAVVATNTAGPTEGVKRVFATSSIVIPEYALSVVVTGSGSVTGSGISCPSNCSHSYPAGTVVTLTATPGSGYHFSDWEGACSGSGSCVVTISAAASVSAIFVANPIPPTPAPPAPPTPTPPAPPAPVVTASAPAFKHLRAPSVKVKGKKVSLDTGYELVCAGTGPDCSFSLVSSHGVIIGKLSGATASGGTTELVVQLNANGLKLLKKQKSLLVTLKLSASRGTQSLSPAVVKITVKRPPRLPR